MSVAVSKMMFLIGVMVVVPPTIIWRDLSYNAETDSRFHIDKTHFFGSKHIQTV